jgi:hypothetical protein
MLPASACDEIIDFFMAGKSPEQLDAFRPSAETRDRVTWLVGLAKDDLLSTQERSELEDFLQLEHLMILAKARARRHIIG